MSVTYSWPSRLVVQLLDASVKVADEIWLEVRDAGMRNLEKSSDSATSRL